MSLYTLPGQNCILLGFGRASGNALSPRVPSPGVRHPEPGQHALNWSLIHLLDRQGIRLQNRPLPLRALFEEYLQEKHSDILIRFRQIVLEATPSRN
jgi:hypothetical protein